MGSLMAELWEPSLLPLIVGTPICGCPRMAGRAGGLLDTLSVHPAENVTEEEPGADPAAIPTWGTLELTLDRRELVQLLYNQPQETKERKSVTIPRGSP